MCVEQDLAYAASFVSIVGWEEFAAMEILVIVGMLKNIAHAVK